MPFSLSVLNGKKVLLLTHSGADIDSLGSAAAIYFSLKGKSKMQIGVCDRPDGPAKRLAQNLKIPYKINPPLTGFDICLCLDFSKKQMLGSMLEEFESFKGEKYCIDHHEKHGGDLVAAKNALINNEAVSATEIVYALLKDTMGVRIPQKAYACIAAGIITDSAGFQVADFSTFEIMAQVLKNARLPYSKITSYFYVKKNLSEKVATLKAAKRCRIFSSGESVIAISEVGAFEADAASSLVRLGADAAFCGYADKGEMRVSGRVNNSWLRESGLDLSRDVFKRLGDFFDGAGGGHPGAAGFTGKGADVNPVLEKCASLVNEFLGAKKKDVQLKEYT